MPKAYYEPEALLALGEVLNEAKAVLERRGEYDPANLDWVATRILELASQGMPPPLILTEVIRQMSPSKAGISASEISLTADRQSGSN